MSKNIYLMDNDGNNLYPRTTVANVFIDPLTPLDKKIIKNIFPVNSYAGSDSEKIQRAFDECKANGGGIVVLDGNYEVDTTLILDADYVQLVSYNSSVIKFTSEEEDLPLLRVISAPAAVGADATCHNLSGFTLEGTNRKGIGILFGANDDEDYTSRDIKLTDVKITNFNTGIEYRKNAYIITVDKSALSSCNCCVIMKGGYSNYGERITFTNTTLCNSTMLVRMSNREGIMNFISCSFDYSNQFIENQGGNIFINNSHLEFRHLGTNYPWLIYCGANSGHGSIVIRDSAFVCTNPGNENYDNLFVCDSGGLYTDARYEIVVDSCRMIHWKTKTGFLCGGNEYGIFKIKNLYLNQIPSVNFQTKPSNNLADRLNVDSYDPSLAKVEFISQEVNGATRRIAKITKLAHLGQPCRINLCVPDLLGSITVKYAIKLETTEGNSCWVHQGYKYGGYGRFGSVEIKPNLDYAGEGFAYYFPNNMNVNEYLITIDLNNATQDDAVYVYLDYMYEF